MAKLPRVNQKQFGINGSNGDFIQFGSLAAGSANYTKDPDTLQSLSAFLNGWGSAVIANNRPCLEDMNALFLLAFRQIAYLLQQGIPEYNADAEYHKNSYVQIDGQIYRSLIDNNIGLAPASNPSSWNPGVGTLNYDGVPSGAIIMWSGTVANIPGGYYFCDGTNGTPDLRDKMVIGAKQDSGGVAKTNVTGSLTKEGGEATVTLSTNEMPNHTHGITLSQNSNGGTSGYAVNSQALVSAATETSSATGGGAAHNNMPPYYALCFIQKA